MKTYTFIIGSTDDFEFIESLVDYVEQEGYDGNLNYSIFEFDCPADCSEEIVTMMARGYAFSSDWCEDHTFSFFVKGPLFNGYIDDADEKVNDEVQNHDLWEM